MNLLKNYTDFCFDFDGTVVDTSEDIIVCIKKAYLNIMGCEIDLSSDVIGPPLFEMLKKIFPDLNEDLIQKVLTEFRFLYDDSIFLNTRLYSGITDVCKILLSNGKRIYVVTNKPLKPTKKIIDLLQINYFSDVICPDIIQDKILDKYEMIKYVVQKWNINCTNAVMIGDSASDVIAAKKSNIASIALLSGYDCKNNIAESKPSLTLNDANDLYQIIKSGELL